MASRRRSAARPAARAHGLGVTSAGVGEHPRQRSGTVSVAGQHPACPPRRTAVCGCALTRLITSVSCRDQPQPGARQRHRRHVRQHGDPIPAEQPDQRGCDAVQQRVAAGQHVHVCVGVVKERRQGGQQRRRPLMPHRRHRVVQVVRAGAEIRKPLWLWPIRRVPSAPARPSRRRLCRPRRCGSPRHPSPNRLRKHPHDKRRRPQRPWNPHRGTALGQGPYGRGRNLRWCAGKGCGLHALRHAADDEAGTHDEQPDTGAVQGVGQSAGEPVETRLGRSVHVVGPAHPHPGDRGEHDDGPRVGAARIVAASTVSRLTCAT